MRQAIGWKERNIRGYEGKVLVLDDDFDLARLVKQILQKDGFKNVFAFTDPLLALEHFRINHKDYSLIISEKEIYMLFVYQI